MSVKAVCRAVRFLIERGVLRVVRRSFPGQVTPYTIFEESVRKRLARAAAKWHLGNEPLVDWFASSGPAIKSDGSHVWPPPGHKRSEGDTLLPGPSD
jgi:hypothetical protein